jgi:hypothetical protein
MPKAQAKKAANFKSGIVSLDVNLYRYSASSTA